MHQPKIPEGSYYGLTFHMPRITETGPFIKLGCGHKIVWHTTESTPGHGTNAMTRVLIAKEAEPHFVLDPVRRYVQQLVSLDQYARALEHPHGTPHTNRASAIQVEIIGFAGRSPQWDDHIIDSIAMLALLIEHRVSHIVRGGPRFRTTPVRMSGAQFLAFSGHCGHEHVPNQPSGHWDPGALDIHKVFAAMAKLSSHD